MNCWSKGKDESRGARAGLKMPSGKPRLFFKSSFGFLPEKRELTSRSGSGNICRDTGQATR